MNWPAHWLFGLPKPTISSNRSQKIRQIESLKSTFRDVREIIKDQQFILPIYLPSIPDLRLMIDIPMDYPTERVVIKVEPPIKHKIINEDMVVNLPVINNQTVDLIDIINEIRKELDKFPPTPLLPPRMTSHPITTISSHNNFYPNLDNLGGTYANSDNNTMIEQFNTTMPFRNLQNTKSYVLPEIPHDFSAIEQMSVSELKELTENEGKLFEFISTTLPPIKKLTQDRDEFLINIKKLAKNNLEYKPVMEEKKNTLLKHIDDINAKRAELEAIYNQLKSAAEKYDPMTLGMNLRIAANQMEEKSETVYERFLEGKIIIEDFTKEFLEQRQLCHLRRIKEEKLQQEY